MEFRNFINEVKTVRYEINLPLESILHVFKKNKLKSIQKGDIVQFSNDDGVVGRYNTYTKQYTIVDSDFGFDKLKKMIDIKISK